MDKLFLLSFIFSTVAFPALFAREARSKRGLVLTIVATAAFNVMYAVGLIFVWTRLQ